MRKANSEIRCTECEQDYDLSMLAEESSCPKCGKQLLFYPGLSRGSAAEKLADRRAEASTEEEEDMYRAVLHFLACNLLKKQDVFHFLAMGNFTENLQYALGEAIENAESTENGAVLVCPNCEEIIKSWVRWYIEGEASSN